MGNTVLRLCTQCGEIFGCHLGGIPRVCTGAETKSGKCEFDEAPGCPLNLQGWMQGIVDGTIRLTNELCATDMSPRDSDDYVSDARNRGLTRLANL